MFEKANTSAPATTIAISATLRLRTIARAARPRATGAPLTLATGARTPRGTSAAPVTYAIAPRSNVGVGPRVASPIPPTIPAKNPCHLDREVAQGDCIRRGSSADEVERHRRSGRHPNGIKRADQERTGREDGQTDRAASDARQRSPMTTPEPTLRGRDEVRPRESVGQASRRNAKEELGQDAGREEHAHRERRAVRAKGQPAEHQDARVHREAAQQA